MTTDQTYLWTVDEYHRLIESGFLTPEDNLELLDGQIIQKNPQSPVHAATTQHIYQYLQNQLKSQADVRSQRPITLSTSVPEPDIAVVRIDTDEHSDRYPTPNQILLLIEVADTTLVCDREQKAAIYARANIPDYWIVDLTERQVHICRNPSKQRYQSQTILNKNVFLAPLAFPEIEIPFSELFLP